MNLGRTGPNPETPRDREPGARESANTQLPSAAGPAKNPREVMAGLGIVQGDDPSLHRKARLFDLPAEADDARRVVIELNAAAERVGRAHPFRKGMGIAAPQIGIDRSASVIRTPDGETITLLNPKIIDESGLVNEQYEGCLSFFDVRGQVPRSHAIHVEHTTIDGTTKITAFELGLARLVSHEVDHLHGRLYTDRMRGGIEPIPVEQYRGPEPRGSTDLVRDSL
jgi:peptide deformylase